VTRERVTVAPTAATREARASILERARHRGFRRFALPPGEDVPSADDEEILVRAGDRLTFSGTSPREVPVVTARDPGELEAAVRSAPSGGILALEWTGDRIIPLENAIAAANRRIELWVFARNPREVPAALGALEHGAQRVIVELRSPDQVDELEALLEGPLASDLAWTLVPVAAVRAAGVGDRVIVDTTSLLDPDEGLLVGSAAGFLFHVASEAVGSQFSRPRPFRVNAGAAHSYVLMGDGSTRYLSELEPGDAVLVSRPGGTVRSARVGRVKIERRPMVAVSAVVDETMRTVFLQEAETVRLSAEGRRIPMTELAPGIPVHGVRMAPGRHLGRAVEETIVER